MRTRTEDLESPYLTQELLPTQAGDDWKPCVARLLRESPFARVSIPDEWRDAEERSPQAARVLEAEYFDDEDRDAQEAFEPMAVFEAQDDSVGWSSEGAPSPPEQNRWVLALDRSAIERLPDAVLRRRFLEEIDWREVEFPGNVPKGRSETETIRRHWRLADELFSAMTAVVPERRVPGSIRYRDVAVVEVPGQPRHRLFAEARDAFVRLRDAASADGVQLVITSSWRSSKKQADISRAQPNPKAAARGKSAHMYGLAVDLRMSVPGLQVAEANTRTSEKMANLVRMYRSPVYKWMALRGREFGWYPYRREPWHWEYNPPGFKARFEGGASTASGAADPQAVSEPVGGKHWTFKSETLPMTVAVYCPTAALGQSQVEVLVFAHGLLHVCGGPASASGLVLHHPFKLARIIDASLRPIVLVVPEMNWQHNRGNHPLGRPTALNGVLAEALQELGRVQGRAAPSLSALVLAGHSRAYGFLGPLARAHSDPQMAQGALAALSEVWALDTTYEYNGSHDPAGTRAWLESKPRLRLKVVYRKGSLTAPRAIAIGKIQHDRLELIEVPRSESHCAVPVARLPGLLRSLGHGGSDTEIEDETLTTDSADDPEFEFALMADEPGGDTQELAHEADLAWSNELDNSREAQALDELADETDFEATGVDPYDLEPRESESAEDEVEAAAEWVEEYDEAAMPLEDGSAAEEASFEAEDGLAVDAGFEHDSPAPTGASDASLRDAIVSTALKEWELWERGAKKETSADMRPHLARYWSAVIKPSQIDQFIAKRHAWSAAFVSWVMKRAGAGSAFRTSPYHTVYIAAAKKNRGDSAKFRAFRTDEVAVEVGDVVCKDRRPGTGAPCAGTTYDNVHTPDAKGDTRISHGDIVLEVDSVRHRARVIGGNVGNSVDDGWIKLTADNRLPATAGSGCAYIAVLKCPGAAPSAGPAAPDSSAPLPRLPQLGAGQVPSSDPGAFRKFRLTTYHVVDQNELPTGTVRIPILDDQGRRIAEGSPAFFGQLALEGTGRLADGRLINVTGKTVSVSHADYADVLAYHRQAYAGADRKRREQGRDSTPTQYSGIVVQSGRVVRAFGFHEVPASRRGVGYGTSRGVPYTPFRTLAADIGHTKYAKVDPTLKGKGGLVPPGTQVYIKEYDGLRLPDGSTHDGWFIVNDTGGAIFGAHFDVFTGTRALRKRLKLPEFGQVWFAGIEQRIPTGYTYGLSK